MLVALCIGITLSVTVAAIHFESFNLIARSYSRLSYRPRMLAVFLSVYLTHLIEIVIYTGAYYVLNNRWGLGYFSEPFSFSLTNLFYYSTVSYTTLGLSSFYAQGPLKIVASLESLTGFMLITWSASFAYRSFGRFWKLE